MKKNFYVLFFVCLFSIFVPAQKINKPTLIAKEPTEAQRTLIKQAVALHDARRFDDAIKIYEQVLKENPDCTVAIYEMAISLYSTAAKEKAITTALQGLKYKSAELPLFYGFLANDLDDRGFPQKAVQIYQDGIKILEEDKSFPEGLANLYFNLGVTHTRQKQYQEARQALKKAVEFNARYASPHYVLSEVFYGSRYKIPALLAAARFVSLEFNSQRAQRAAALIQEIVKDNSARAADGKVTINLDLSAPSDEGDFGALDLLLSVSDAAAEKKGETSSQKSLTAEEKFAGKIETLIGFLETGDKKNQSTFVGKNYFPFMLELKKRGYAKHFAYLVLFQSGNASAEKWLNDNNQKTIEFINWAKSYQSPGK